MVCGDRHWTPYQVETLSDEQEEAWELCTACCLIIPEKKKETREDRGIALAKERFDAIVKIRPWTWRVPSRSSDGSYEVNLKHESCSCPDRPPQGERCLHVHALEYLLKKSGQCTGCRHRFWWRELIEVTEDHESLTFFVGDTLCFECAMATGVL